MANTPITFSSTQATYMEPELEIQRSLPVPIPKIILQGVRDQTDVNEKFLSVFFKRQHIIGQQKQENEIPCRYSAEVYQKADLRCFSQYNSTDWRRKKISVLATEAAFELIAELFHARTLIPPCSDLIEGPSRLSCEEGKLPHYEPGNYPSYNTIQKRIFALQHKDPEENPGPVFLKDLFLRIRNIFQNWMAPLLQNLKTELGQPKENCLRAILYEPLACEVARIILRQGLAVNDVDSLVEPYVSGHGGSPGTKDRVLDMAKGALSW